MQPMPDIAALLKIAQSPAGQKLLAMLQASSADLSRITDSAAAGNLEEARKAISELLSGEEARQLLKQLEKQL